MNLKEAKRLKPGSMVRMSWETYAETQGRTGIVLSKMHVKERHMAKGLSQWRDEKYDLIIHWFKKPFNIHVNPCVMENWQVMVVSHV
jgi:hypothetical protein